MEELDDIRQNLIDAGCSEETIKCFFECKNHQEQLKVLSSQRKDLLESYHQEIRKIDCLDFLVNKIHCNCKKESTK